MNRIVRRAIALGVSPAHAFIAASFNAAQRFGLSDTGAIAPGYFADLVLLSDREVVAVEAVYKRGSLVARDGALTKPLSESAAAGRKAVSGTVRVGDFSAASLDTHSKPLPVIGLVPHELITVDAGMADAVRVEDDLLKLAVIERHKGTGHTGLCFLKGYGLKSGAVATTVAHDSHNIIVVGTNDGDMALAVDTLRQNGGGMVVADGGEIRAELTLPIAGLMCDLDAEEAEAGLARVRDAAYALGASREIDPLMTLSFMSLPVIPHRKLTTLGVVDVDAFRLIR